MTRYGASMRKACAAIQLSRVVYLYQSAARDNTALVMRMKEITQTRVHYGYRRVHVMLKREGFKVSNGMDAPTRNGIDVPKWKRYFNHLNREGRPP
jgi:hypothetical protein